MIQWAHERGHPSTVLTRNVKSHVCAGVRWFTWFRGEPRGSWVDHYLFLLSDRASIVEALLEGTVHGVLRKYEESTIYWGVIVEHVGFAEHQHLVADGAALDLVGAPYNLSMFARQAGDGLLSKLLGRDVYACRKFAPPWSRSTICSGLGVRVHKIAGWLFMCPKTVYRKVGRGFTVTLRAVQVLAPLPMRRACPDDIWDDVFEHRPHLYRIAGEINPVLRPDDLPQPYVSKIESDLTQTAGS